MCFRQNDVIQNSTYKISSVGSSSVKQRESFFVHVGPRCLEVDIRMTPYRSLEWLSLGFSWCRGYCLWYRTSLPDSYEIQILFVHSIHFNCQIVLEFTTEQGCGTKVFCAKYHNDLTTEKWIRDKQLFPRFVLKLCFRAIFGVVTAPRPQDGNQCWPQRRAMIW